MPINSWATAVLLGAARRRCEIYTLFFLFIYLFLTFLKTRTGKTTGPIFMHDTSKCVFRRTVHF